MGASSYPGMTQPFSMSHSANMGSVGVRQDSMGMYWFYYKFITLQFEKESSEKSKYSYAMLIQQYIFIVIFTCLLKISIQC